MRAGVSELLTNSDPPRTTLRKPRRAKGGGRSARIFEEGYRDRDAPGQGQRDRRRGSCAKRSASCVRMVLLPASESCTPCSVGGSFRYRPIEPRSPAGRRKAYCRSGSARVLGPYDVTRGKGAPAGHGSGRRAPFRPVVRTPAAGSSRSSVRCWCDWPA